MTDGYGFWSLRTASGMAAAAAMVSLGLMSAVWLPAPALAQDNTEEEQAAGDQAAEPEEPTQEEAAEGDVEPDWEEKPYDYVDGKVDFGTYNGFRRYHSSCHVCHGPDGLGSTYAPPLIESIPRIGYEGYLEAVVNGIENVSTSEQSVMPSFGEDPNVMNYVDDIYSYLKARADGVIGRGRPERLPKEE